MKSNIVPYLSFLICGLTANSLSFAADGAWRGGTPAPAAGVRGETRSMERPMGAGEKEIVTFLGVETAPVSETLGSQLSLAKDSGLVVVHVVPDSPAASALKEHDVLLKMDDQLLVEPRQFSVLIRNHKEGDEVTFTYIRASKQATAKVKLGKHEIPKMVEYRLGVGRLGDTLTVNPDALRRSREETDRVLNLIQGGPHEVRTTSSATGQHNLTFQGVQGAAGFRATNVNTANSNMVFTDEQGSLDLTIKDGKKTLVAKNPKGDQVFSGPVNTPEERNALPPEVRDRLDKLEGMRGFTFKTEDGFVPATRTLRAFPEEISFPRPPGDAREGSPGPRVFLKKGRSREARPCKQ